MDVTAKDFYNDFLALLDEAMAGGDWELLFDHVWCLCEFAAETAPEPTEDD